MLFLVCKVAILIKYCLYCPVQNCGAFRPKLYFNIVFFTPALQFSLCLYSSRNKKQYRNSPVKLNCYPGENRKQPPTTQTCEL